ncbi:MAG: hypothetical protein OSB69_16100 [Alphaproteobacteria bacterium]|nr:hypothetical protein [Alphaproteobacteria bacterium]
MNVDTHLDSGLGTDAMEIHQVCPLTETFDRGGLVAVGHGTNYSCLRPADLAALAWATSP